MNDKVQIREIHEDDSSRVAELSEELGYPVAFSLIEEQIRTINSDSNHFGYAAILENRVVGYIHGFLSIRLTRSPFLEIGGLIVSKDYSNRGIGRKLVDHFEQQVKGCDMIRVRCNVKRDSAHKFYLALNYSEKKEQKIFERKLHRTKSKLH